MPRPTTDALRRLAAELLQEVARIDQTVAEAALADARLGEHPDDRLAPYAAAAILDTFYTGIEKALARIAPAMNGGLPEGPAWHRRLLENMAMDIPGVRPAVLTPPAPRALDPYLSFRHRFRNLYLFDLAAAPIRALLGELPRAWDTVRTDLCGFATTLTDIAGAFPHVPSSA